MLFKVSYQARSLSSGFIAQSVVVTADDWQTATLKVASMLARQMAAGAWFVDWIVGDAELVG